MMISKVKDLKDFWSENCYLKESETWKGGRSGEKTSRRWHSLSFLTLDAQHDHHDAADDDDVDAAADDDDDQANADIPFRS